MASTKPLAHRPVVVEPEEMGRIFGPLSFKAFDGRPEPDPVTGIPGPLSLRVMGGMRMAEPGPVAPPCPNCGAWKGAPCAAWCRREQSG